MQSPIVAPDTPFPNLQDMPQGISISYEETREISCRHNLYYVLRCWPPLLLYLFCSVCVVAILLPLLVVGLSSFMFFIRVIAVLLITFSCHIICQLLFVLIILVIYFLRRESKRKH